MALSSLHTIFLVVAGVLHLSMFVLYIRSILQRSISPSAVSWFGWAVYFTVMTVAQASKGIDLTLAIAFGSAICALAIAFTALYKGRLVSTAADGICIVVIVLTLVLWTMNQGSLTGIVLSIIADFVIMIPTIIKTYQNPKSEPALPWILFLVAVILELAASPSYTLDDLLFPVYVVCGAAIIVVLVDGRIQRMLKSLTNDRQ